MKRAARSARASRSTALADRRPNAWEETPRLRPPREVIADWRRAILTTTRPSVSRFALASKTLDIIAHHRDLACVRSEDQLKKLREDERRSRRAFRGDVAVLLKKAG